MPGRKGIILWAFYEQGNLCIQPAGSLSCDQIFQDQISNDKRNCHGYHHLDSNFAVFLRNTKRKAKYNPENTGISYRGESCHDMVKNRLMNLLQLSLYFLLL